MRYTYWGVGAALDLTVLEGFAVEIAESSLRFLEGLVGIAISGKT